MSADQGSREQRANSLGGRGGERHALEVGLVAVLAQPRSQCFDSRCGSVAVCRRFLRRRCAFVASAVHGRR
eukprot:13725110-Alexandrium_andersonii.AAC.1